MNRRNGKMKTREKEIRLYANHLGLTARKRGRVIGLFWRYGDRRKIGEHGTWGAVEQALTRITAGDIEGNGCRATARPHRRQRDRAN